MLGQLAPRPRIGLAVTAGIAGVAGIGLALPSEPVPTLALLTPVVLSSSISAARLKYTRKRGGSPFIAEVRAALDVDPRLVERLGIEVTETAAMQNVERSMHTIDMFRQWGLAVAIDDFGTGYSSLSYLKQLTVDVIKIDRSFVMGLPDGERDGAITDRFGFATLAEGIETEEQAAWLLEHGCRYGQGYLIAKPFSFDDLLECVAGYAA